MLNGVGGRTIAEAKATLTYDEVLAWAEYRSIRGTLNMGRRVECAAALITTALIKVNGGRATLADYTPHERQLFENDIDEMTQLMKSMGAVVRHREKK